MDVIPTCHAALLGHPDFSRLTTPCALMEHLDTLTPKHIASKQIKLCIWYNTVGIHENIVHFLVGSVWYYDKTDRVVVMKVRGRQMHQKGIEPVVVSEAIGFIAISESTYMILNKSTWQKQVTSSTIPIDGMQNEVLSIHPPASIISTVLVPLVMLGIENRSFRLSREACSWCKSQLINPKGHCGSGYSE